MSMRYEPPKLPTYLANTFDLKTVVGVPTDDEVKVIHAVIRAVDTASQIPEWCDPSLSMELAQHLFDVQMARYGDKYPVSVFPTNHTYTPPTLPSHIKVPLEPITGAPSDDEVKLVHTALRLSENLVNLPSVFDPDLSMNLSQHLFDIQFARYLQRTTEGHYTDRGTKNAQSNRVVRTEKPRDPVDSASDTEAAVTPEADRGDEPVSESEPGVPASQAPPGSPDVHSKTTALSEDTRSIIGQLKANQDQTDQRLAGLQDTLENVTQLMVKLHNHSARGFNTGRLYPYHHIVNDSGEAPTADLPGKLSPGNKFWSSASGATLAQYLKFYNIGLGLIEGEGSTTVKPGSEREAMGILGKHTHIRDP